jgi:hypothetical protein
MGQIQQAIYDALIGRYRGSFSLETRSRALSDKSCRLMERAVNWVDEQVR